MSRLMGSTRPAGGRGVEEETLNKPKLDHGLIQRLFRYVKPYRRVLIIAVSILLVSSLVDLAFPLLIRRGIDDHIRPGELDGLLRLSLVFLGLLVANFGLRFAHLYMTQYLGQRVMHDLRVEIFSHVQRLHIGYFDRNPVGRVMTRITNDVEVLNQMFTSGMVSVFGDLITLLGIAGVLFYLNTKLALVTLTVVPLLFIASMLFRTKVRKSHSVVRIKVAAINAFLQENIAGISLVQLFNRQRHHREQFDVVNVEHRDAYLKTVFYYSIFFPTVEFLESLAVALILWYGGGLTVQSAITLGSLIAFIQYSERFFRPIRDLSERYNILQGAMASSERIFELLDTEPEVSSLGSSTPTQKRGEVTFEDVHFSYLPGEKVLGGISFRVAPGESVALVGHTGAGKTTISNLLSRFYEIDSGRITIDGVDVRDWDLPQLRRQIGVVQQESFLWSGSLGLNVGLRDGLPKEDVERALDLVGAHTLLERFSEGGDFEVGERGNQLSVGERQLVCFARALAHDPPILVLDEATSSVDTETEMKIRHALEVLLAGRTSLVIAHRLSTIRHVDRILVLHKGQVVESGTHDELIARGGLYSRYYELEYRGQEAAVVSP